MTLEMKLHQRFEDGKKVGQELGRIEGEKLVRIELICKKIGKGYSAEEIADLLEEDIEVIQPIYDIAVKQKPDFNAELILQKL